MQRGSTRVLDSWSRLDPQKGTVIFIGEASIRKPRFVSACDNYHPKNRNNHQRCEHAFEEHVERLLPGVTREVTALSLAVQALQRLSERSRKCAGIENVSCRQLPALGQGGVDATPIKMSRSLL